MSLQVGKNFKKSREKDHQKLITIVNGQTSLSKAKRAQAQGQGRAGAGNCTRNMLQPNPTSKDKKRDLRSLLTLAPLMWRWAWGTHPCSAPPLSLPAGAAQSSSSTPDQEPDTHPIPSTDPRRCQTSQNIFRLSQGNPAQEYFKHTYLKMPSLLQLLLRRSYPG